MQVLKDHDDRFQELLQRYSSQPDKAQFLSQIVSAMIEDYVHEKFDVEEEDQIKSMQNPQLMMDPEVQNIAMEMEQEMGKLLGGIPPIIL